MIKKMLKTTTIKNFIHLYEKWFTFGTIILFVLGFYLALFESPIDYQQGEFVRIMYVHVPSAWMSLMIYSIIALSSGCYLIFKTPIANEIAKASAGIGAIFALITLITGSIWGQPIWGTWWVWDARLTSMLILFFFYLSYILTISSLKNNRDNKAPSIIAIIGFINVPIVKFSVDFWNSLHQPASIIRIGGPAIDNSMLKPLIVIFLATLCFYILILCKKIKISLAQHKLERSIYYSQIS